MHWFFLAIIVICIALMFANGLTKADPRKLARGIKVTGAILAFLVAAILFFAGRVAFALPLAALGMMLLGRGGALGGLGGFGFPGGRTKSAGQKSSVKTDFLEVVLDHDTVEMSGRFLRGPLEGRRLDEFGEADLVAALRELDTADPRGAQLLETYLDRTFEDWRDRHGAADDEGAGKRGGNAGPMSREEALMVLGLSPGASKRDIRDAHRRLMKKLHPDQGGSTALAAKVNEAKDLLLGG